LAQFVQKTQRSQSSVGREERKKKTNKKTVKGVEWGPRRRGKLPRKTGVTKKRKEVRGGRVSENGKGGGTTWNGFEFGEGKKVVRGRQGGSS